MALSKSNKLHRFKERRYISFIKLLCHQIRVIFSSRENKKSAQLKQINNICQHIDSIMDNETLYSRVVEVIQKNLGYDHVALYLVDYKTNSIILTSLCGIYEGLVPPQQRLKINQGIVGHVVQNGKTILSNDAPKNPHFYNASPYQAPTKSELCVPIKIEGKIIGVLNIESTEIMNFDDDDLNSLEVLANRIGVAIHNSRLYSKLERNNQRLYDIVSSMGQGIILIDKNFKIEWTNRAFIKWGWEENNIINKQCYEIFGRNNKYCLHCPGEKVFQTGEICRHLILTESGEQYMVTSAPIKDDDGTVKQVLEVFDDVTENINLKKKLDQTKEQLEKSKYLTVIGELTTNIAHEIRNPLNAISTAIDILQCDLEVNGDDKKLLNIVKEESKRLNEIISTYLSFACTPKLNLSHNDIQTTIEETIMLLKIDRKTNEEVKFLTYFEKGLPKLKFDKDLIKQVFWNLYINSIQSITSKGFVETNVRKNNNVIEISVRDSGKGIPKNRLKNVFEQFYSSKVKGTGLGLAIVRRIIEQHNWSIDVESEVGVGTTFRIEAPLTD